MTALVLETEDQLLAKHVPELSRGLEAERRVTPLEAVSRRLSDFLTSL